MLFLVSLLAEALIVSLDSPVVCVVGASGFIGQNLVRTLARQGADFRCLRRPMSVDGSEFNGIYFGDIFDPESLISFFAGADILINLAQPAGVVTDERFAEGIGNLANAARIAGIQRVLHISTAMVVGVPEGGHVTELSECHPITAYERQKLSAERLLQGQLSGQIDFGILRPTAVFGSGGQNLLKLADGISNGSGFKRHLLRFLHGKRNMHLVSVEDVVEAIVFLAFLPRALEGNVFLIAADEQPANNYQAVDAIIGAAMGKVSLDPSFSLPNVVLRSLLRWAGRSQADPTLIYDASKIRTWGFQPQRDFTLSLEAFAKAYMKNSRQ